MIMLLGIKVREEKVDKAVELAVQSAFLKANTRNELLVIEAGEGIARQIPAGQMLKVKLEVDTDPPASFETQTRYLLQPIPFAVRCYTLPDLFAGKMHAILFRRWKNRVKGRDWYDLVWYVANHPQLHLAHLEQRMRQTGQWSGEQRLSPAAFADLLYESIDRLDVNQASRDVAPFVKNQQMLAMWSRDFFQDVARRIEIVDEDLSARDKP